MGTTNHPEPERYRIRRHMAEWRRQEGHGVRGPLERRWCADSRRRVVTTQASRHGCLFLTCEGEPPLAVAILPDWVDTVDPIYRELLFREIWRDYKRKLARYLRGEPIRDEDDDPFDYSADVP